MLYPIYNKKCPVCDKEDLDHLILKCEKYDEYCGDIERFCLLMKSVMRMLLRYFWEEHVPGLALFSGVDILIRYLHHIIPIRAQALKDILNAR